MKYKNIVNTNTIVRSIINSHIKPGDIVLDCTVGNGNDTIYLAEKVGPTGKVYGFDIQDVALEVTGNLLKDEGYIERVNLIKDSHENIDSHIYEKLDFIIYNLGYLPKGDKTIKTVKASTLISLKKSLGLLNPGGIILITVYIGHEGGIEENEGIEELLSSLNQKEFNVLKFDFINQINYPPILYGVEKSF